MTISSNLMKQQFPGNGAQTVFNFTFSMPAGTLSQQAAQLVVIYTDALGNQTIVSNGPGATQYQLSVNAPVAPNITPQGGSVTYNPNGTPIALGTTLTVIRTLPLTQPSSFANQANIYQATFEGALDYITMLEQQIQDSQTRAIVVNVVDPPPPSLPPAVARANQFLFFDSSGNPTVSPSPIAGAISVAMQPVVSASTLALARSNMGVGGLSDNNTWTGTQTFNNTVSITSTLSLTGAVTINNGSPGQWFENLNNVLTTGFPSQFLGYGQGYNALAQREIDFLNGDPLAGGSSFVWFQQTGASTRKQVMALSTSGVLTLGQASVVSGELDLSGVTSGVIQIFSNSNGSLCTLKTLGAVSGGSLTITGQFSSGNVGGLNGQVSLVGSTSGLSSIAVSNAGAITITSAIGGTTFVDTTAGGTLFKVSAASQPSANFITVGASATGFSPQLLAQGSDTNIGFLVVPKGSGVFTISNSGASPGTISLTGISGQPSLLSAFTNGSGMGIAGLFASNTSGFQTVSGNATITSGLVLVNTVGPTTLTLPVLNIPVGTEINLKMAATNANAIISASANVVPLNANAPGTTIIPANGKFAKIVFDGTNWHVFAQG